MVGRWSDAWSILGCDGPPAIVRRGRLGRYPDGTNEMLHPVGNVDEQRVNKPAADSVFTFCSHPSTSSFSGGLDPWWQTFEATSIPGEDRCNTHQRCRRDPQEQMRWKRH